MEIKLLIFISILRLPTAFASYRLSYAEPLSNTQVTTDCLNAYNEDIPYCDSTQISSRKCTPACQKDLQAYADKVRHACRGGFVGPDRLLRRIMDRGIVSTLCGRDESSIGGATNNRNHDGGVIGEVKEKETSPTSGTTQTTISSSDQETIGGGTLTVNIPTQSVETYQLTSLVIDTGPTPTPSIVSMKTTAPSYSGASVTPTAATTREKTTSSTSAATTPIYSTGDALGVSVAGWLVEAVAVIISLLLVM